MTQKTRQFALPLLAFLFGLIVLSIAVVMTFPSKKPNEPSAVGGPFTLIDHHQKVVTEKDFLGAPHLVFFGFTHCPDICPTKLFEISEVFRGLGDKGKNIRALFITVDPERDTPAILKNYLSSFDDRILGLGGDAAALEQVKKSYRAYSRKVPTKDNDYTMEHTALVYIMDKKGQFIGALNLELPVAENAKQLLKYLE
jgi:protein SCO1